MNVGIVGGGAAGFFAAITCAEANPAAKVMLFERGKTVLEKVRISGGGRCNVTHHCFDPKLLVKYYPRGSRELLGPFMRFGPEQTIEWFENRGVSLKTETDGRMFPCTDQSETIVNCLKKAAQDAGVHVITGSRIDRIAKNKTNQWVLYNNHGQPQYTADRLMIATGSSPAVWDMLEGLGHTIVPPVPSLFTFNTKDTRFRDLSGLSAKQVQTSVVGTSLRTEGPLLITHWGVSGPAVLRLSAWGARELHQMDYKFTLQINWTNTETPDTVYTIFQQNKSAIGKKNVHATPHFALPLRLWQSLVAHSGISEQTRWADMNAPAMRTLAAQCAAGQVQINGKSTFKEEFVTAGGVLLKEIQFNTFSSKLHDNLYLAGEVLDIDAITGGFNFQAAWTGGYLAGLAMGQ